MVDIVTICTMVYQPIFNWVGATLFPNQWPHHIVVGFNVLSFWELPDLAQIAAGIQGVMDSEKLQRPFWLSSENHWQQRGPTCRMRSTKIWPYPQKPYVQCMLALFMKFVNMMFKVFLWTQYFFCNLRFRWLAFPHWWLLPMTWLPSSKQWKMRGSWDEKQVFEKTLLIGPKRSMNQDQTSVWSWKWMKRVWYPARSSFWIHVGCHKDTQEEEHNIFHCWQSQYIWYQCNTAIKQ